jgi:hypothetical protein
VRGGGVNARTDKSHRTHEPQDTIFSDDFAKSVTFHSTKLIIQQAHNIPLKRVHDLERRGEALSLWLCGNSRRKRRKRDWRGTGRVPQMQYF